MAEWLSSLKLELLTGNRTFVRNEWRDPYFHADPFSRLYYISSGQSVILVEKQQLLLRQGYVYLLPSGVPIKLLPPPNGLEHYWLHFTCSMVHGLALSDLFDCPYELETRCFPSPLKHFRQLIELARTRHDDLDPGLKLEAVGRLSLLLSPFISAATERNLRTDPELRSLGRFEAVVNYIETRLDQSITIPALARLVNLHPTYFSNLFKEKFGVPPRQYICQRRVTKAQLMLINTHKSVKEIALAVGYDDEFYFSRIFAKYAGIAPNLYRLRQKERLF